MVVHVTIANLDLGRVIRSIFSAGRCRCQPSVGVFLYKSTNSDAMERYNTNDLSCSILKTRIIMSQFSLVTISYFINSFILQRLQFGHFPTILQHSVALVAVMDCVRNGCFHSKLLLLVVADNDCHCRREKAPGRMVLLLLMIPSKVATK